MSDLTSVESEIRKDLVVIHRAPDAPGPGGIDEDSDPSTVAVEAASPFGWHEFADDVFGLTRFGASAPGPTLYMELGITAEPIAARVAKLLGKE